MFQYYVLEIQKYVDGSFGHIVHPVYDEDPKMAFKKADSKYHEILSYAAVTNLPLHSATLIPPEGGHISSEFYEGYEPETISLNQNDE